jgi:signal transduction histidine kinase
MPVDSGPGMTVVGVVVVYALAVVLPAALLGYALHSHRDSPTARAFAATMAALTVWSGAYLIRLFAPNWAIRPLTLIAYGGVVFTPVALLVFALRYTDREQYVTAGSAALLSAVPVVTVTLLATTGWHGLFYDSLRRATVGPLTVATGTAGPWFWVHTAYSYALLAVASWLLVRFGTTRGRLYRTQAAFLVGGVAVAWATNAAFVAGLSPIPELDLTPVGMALGLSLVAVAVFRARLIDVTPVARDAVVEAMDDAAVVLEAGRVVDCNAAARSLLDADRPVGDPAVEPLPGALVEALATTPTGDGTDDGDRVVDLVRDGERRWYRLRTLPLDRGSPAVPSRSPPLLRPPLSPDEAATDGDGPAATVLLLTDVTAQRHHLRRLRKQNEQLEEFAAAAAHDLRNPLNVIDGYLDLARETGDPAHLDRIDGATDRMSRLVDDLLVLGRRGRLVESTEPVDLETAAREAWRNVDTGGATLSVDGGDPVPADEHRLVQLLENLFLNAVEHGSRDRRAGDDDANPAGDRAATDGGDGGLTVTVGRTPDGFRVADDGDGIPPSHRDRVFDYGFSTTEAGSGFGLAIVETVADAHGWDVTVTESATGGARFEVTGVTRFDDPVGVVAD